MIGSQFQLQDYVSNVQELLHDTQASSWPISRVVSRINDARLDASLDMHCVRPFQTQVQLISGIEAYPLGPGWSLVGVIVTNGGSNYTNASISWIRAGLGNPTQVANGSPTIVNGSITAVNLTQWGLGYPVGGIAPLVLGNGSGATLQAVYIHDVINPVSITYLFNNIRNMLGFLPFTLFQAYMRVFATTAFVSTPAKWTYNQQTQTVYIQPPPNQTYISEWDYTAMPQAQLANLTDLDTDINLPWARGIEFRAAELLIHKHQNFAQARYFGTTYDSYVPRIVQGAGGYRVPNPYNRNFQRFVTR